MLIMGLKHQAATARKWRAAIRQVESHFPTHLPPLLFLTDPDRTPDPLAIAETLPAGCGIIYRHFGAADRTDMAHALADMSERRHLTLLIAADPDLAKRVGADGVHWPEVRLVKARAWRDQFAVQTASAHSRRAIWRAQQYGIDAVLVSSVYPSKSKSAGTPLGTARFRTLVNGNTLPIYALGGVTATNSGQIAACAGLSAVSAFS
ncbi:MAG: thiamine phosphate synthase [Hyphomonadaceae bacterium]|nr:thiamine phosphate synthase [Hyphomonadaceae bacterium]